MATGDLIAFEVLGPSSVMPDVNIVGEGYVARMRFEGMAAQTAGVLDPSKGHAILAMPGYVDRAPVSDSVVMPLDFLSIHRQMSPNEALRCVAAAGADLDIWVALSDWVHVDDVIQQVELDAGFFGTSNAGVLTTGITQNSTRPYPQPVTKLLHAEPWMRITAAGRRCEAIVDQWHARYGQPVDAVDFYLTSGGEAVTQATYELSQQVTAPYYVPCYGATVLPTALAQGEATLNFRIYPHVGNAIWDTATLGEAWPTFNLSNAHPVNIDTDGSYAPAWAYVSHTGVQIGTPTIQTGAIGAYVPGTTPAYATIKDVALAGKTFNNSAGRARAHNDIAEIHAVVPAGNLIQGLGANMAATATYTPGLGLFRIIREPGSDIATTGLTSADTAVNKFIPSRICLDNISVTPGAAGATHIVVDGSTAGAPTSAPTAAAAVYVVVKGCVGTGANDNTNTPIRRPGFAWFLNNNFAAFGDDLFNASSATVAGWAAIHGGSYDHSGASGQAPINAGSLAGVRFKRFGMASQIAGLVRPVFTGIMVHSCRLDSELSTPSNITIPLLAFAQDPSIGIGVEGISIVNTILRVSRSAGTAGSLSGGEPPILMISGDMETTTNTDKPAVQNVLLGHLTVVGARANIFYNEGTPAGGAQRVEKVGRFVGCAMSQANSKGDTFAGPTPSGIRSGTMARRYGTSILALVTGDLGANTSEPSPTSWQGEIVPPMSELNVGYSNMFVLDTSLAGTNEATNDGDYMPAAKLLDRIPVNRAVAGWDMGGNLRKLDGTGAAGALERESAAGFTLTADAGAFALAGGAASFRVARRIIAAAGAFALTGGAASFSLLRHYALTAATGAFALTGGDAAFRLARRIKAGAGSFTLTGHPASFVTIGAYQLAAGAGAFVLSGGAATFRRGRALAAGAGSFALTGGQAVFRTARRLAAASGAFTLTGRPANLVYSGDVPVAELITLADAKDYLRVDHDDDDALITDLIAAGIEWVERYTGHLLSPRAVTEQFDGFARLVFDAWPVSAISSIEYLDSVGTLTVLDPAVYRLAGLVRPARAALNVGQRWPTGLAGSDAVTVTLEAGYASPAAVPLLLFMAAKVIIAGLYEGREDGGLDDNSQAAAASLCRSYRSWAI